MDSIKVITECIALIRGREDISVPDNVYRTSALVVKRGVNDECSRVVALSLASFCHARGLPCRPIGDTDTINMTLHAWFADPTRDTLKDAVNRL